jgi:hypothetical protein
MSKIALSGNASGTGTFTIASPNSSTDRTLDLPDAAGTIQVSGNPISGTTGTFTGLVDISAAGAGQIQFPATQNASANANTLDDYEEGTWTATLTGDTTAPSTPVTTTGYYTKIGNVVTASVQFNDVNNTGASGSARITGFPFTSASAVPSVGSGWNSRVATSLTVFWMNVSATSASFLDSLGNGLPWVSTGSGTYVGVTITYRV